MSVVVKLKRDQIIIIIIINYEILSLPGASLEKRALAGLRIPGIVLKFLSELAVDDWFGVGADVEQGKHAGMYAWGLHRQIAINDFHPWLGSNETGPSGCRVRHTII